MISSGNMINNSLACFIQISYNRIHHVVIMDLDFVQIQLNIGYWWGPM